ncbi:MAG: phosphate ABC transporter permease PstA [Prevotellaceae bacterium]|nr:phosphate ABC transporter permease PstA [Prevotellaceae bacterium]
MATDRLTLWTICALAALTAVPLLAILGEVLFRGYDQLSWAFFTEPTPTAYRAMKAIQAGEPIPGGIANGIIGTVIMLGMAVALAVPTGILCGAFLAENAQSRFAQTVSYLTDLLQGTPSVIIGIITYIWIVVPMKGYSAIAGSIALFIMMLPLIIRSTEETLKILPTSLKEAGLALGGNKARVMLKVQLPAAFSGIFTGVLLAISRVIGETAPLMFTALGCSLVRFSINKPISAVPLLIWEFFNDPNLQELIWGASLFLLLFVLTLNLTAKYIAKKWNI